MSTSAGPLTTVPEARGILAFEWILVGFCMIMITARFLVRRLVVKRIYADDWFILIALCLQITFQVLETLCSEATIRVNGKVENMRFVVLSTKYAAFAVGPSFAEGAMVRISATILLVRIFNSVTWLKWYLIGLTTIQAIFSALTVIFFYTTAKPVSSLWDPAVESDVNAEFMFTTFWLSIAVAVMYTLSDLTYVLFPTIIICRKVRLSTARKVGLSLLMFLSLLMVATSIARAVLTLSSGIKNTKTIYKGFWASFEQSLAICVTCIPPLLPVTKVDHPTVNKVRSAFQNTVRNLSNRFGSGRSPSRNRPSFVRTVRDSIRQHTGMNSQMHSVHSEEDGVSYVRRPEMTQQGKTAHETWYHAGTVSSNISSQSGR